MKAGSFAAVVVPISIFGGLLNGRLVFFLKIVMEMAPDSIEPAVNVALTTSLGLESVSAVHTMPNLFPTNVGATKRVTHRSVPFLVGS